MYVCVCSQPSLYSRDAPPQEGRRKKTRVGSHCSYLSCRKCVLDLMPSQISVKKKQPSGCLVVFCLVGFVCVSFWFFLLWFWGLKHLGGGVTFVCFCFVLCCLVCLFANPKELKKCAKAKDWLNVRTGAPRKGNKSLCLSFTREA